MIYTSAKTIDYYIEGGGSISCYIVTTWGAGPTSVTITTALTRVFLIGQTDNITDNQISDIIDAVTLEVEMIASQCHFTSDAIAAIVKNQIVLTGAVYHSMDQIYSQGTGTGLMQDRNLIDEDSLNAWRKKYETYLTNLKAGIYPFSAAERRRRINTSTYNN